MGRHPNIHLLTTSEVESVSGYVGNYQIRVRRKARFVDESLCAGCGQCAEVCPVSVANPFDAGLSQRKAIYRFSAQAVPGAYAITKRGVAPCRSQCPADQRAQGYIALIQQQRYADAYWAIRRENPFPSVCGRVCNHRCEEACSRGKHDEPVAIMALKRFVADWAYEHRAELPNLRDKSLAGTPFSHTPIPSGKKVAIIGAGPAGLTAALDLVRLGHAATVFDALSEAGGMMRVGIPPHRLPHERMQWEIDQILAEGVELRLKTWMDDIPGLLQKGYSAVIVATGAHSALKLNIPGCEHPNNWLSLDLLRRACLGQEVDMRGHETIVVLGAGDVALDAARTARRLGAKQVKIVCRGMRASFNEVDEAEKEGIEILRNRVFKEVVIEKGQIAGVRCVEARVGAVVNGRRQVEEIAGSEHLVTCDTVVWAIGQRADLNFLPGGGAIKTYAPFGIVTDDNMMSTMPAVFAAGDIRRGTTFYVVDAIGEGHTVARKVDAYLRGAPPPREPEPLPVAALESAEIEAKIRSGACSNTARARIQTIPPETREGNFREVERVLSEAEALQEAARCLSCGVCSECLECVAACERGAINHEMRDEILELNAGVLVLATGFKDFDPRRAPELGYGSLPNVITALEFERMMNASGPTGGKVLLANGRPPRSLALLHCIGSRDERFHDYCSRACCMISLKLAQLAREYVRDENGRPAEVHEVYRDLRAFGKGYEEFYNRAAAEGVRFYHGRVQSIEPAPDGQLLARWDEAFFGQPDSVCVDMVVLATGFETQEDSDKVAALFGISRSRDGFFMERHPKLAPVETTSEGIYLAGACQSPKDIPDSVAQAGAAAAAALSLLDQGRISLDPAIAEVQPQRCAGCGQCAAACPYGAIEIREQIACVNGYLCKGCGTCAAACPNKAMTLIHFDDRQLIAEIVGALA